MNNQYESDLKERVKSTSQIVEDISHLLNKAVSCRNNQIVEYLKYRGIVRGLQLSLSLAPYIGVYEITYIGEGAHNWSSLYKDEVIVSLYPLKKDGTVSKKGLREYHWKIFLASVDRGDFELKGVE